MIQLFLIQAIAIPSLKNNRFAPKAILDNNRALEKKNLVPICMADHFPQEPET